MNEAQERAEFEAWATKHYTKWPFERWPSGEYKWSLLETAWNVWQARAALAPTVKEDFVSRLEAMQRDGHTWLTIPAVLALFYNSTQKVAARTVPTEEHNRVPMKPAFTVQATYEYKGKMAPRKFPDFDYDPEGDHPAQVLICTGCGRKTDDPPLRPGALACCPDNRYRSLVEVLAELDTLKQQPATCPPGKCAMSVPTEPVAWRTFDGEGGYDYRIFEDNENYRDEYIKRNGEKYASWVEPLYTSPPQRKPLTDAEIDKITFSEWGGEPFVIFKAHRQYARAIEAAHGITGEPE
jgi:hypothetical protein